MPVLSRNPAAEPELEILCLVLMWMHGLFCRGAALQEAARQMRGRGFVLWPDFLGKEAAQRLAGAMRLLRGKPGRLGSVESRSLRGDLVAWPGEADSEQIRAALGEWQQAVDRLVADLRPLLPGEVELGSVDAREPAMLSCYPRGARYIRHYDNNCDTGEGDCNGRRLTVLYYLNEAVSDSDGGHLRLIGQRGGVYDILPELDALVLFWADRRTPHEVLPNLGKEEKQARTCRYIAANKWSAMIHRRTTEGTTLARRSLMLRMRIQE
eukprot:s3162_g1.t6